MRVLINLTAWNTCGTKEHHCFLSQCHVKLKVILKLRRGKTVDAAPSHGV